jgi:hypothetical protein
MGLLESQSKTNTFPKDITQLNDREKKISCDNVFVSIEGNLVFTYLYNKIYVTRFRQHRIIFRRCTLLLQGISRATQLMRACRIYLSM